MGRPWPSDIIDAIYELPEGEKTIDGLVKYFAKGSSVEKATLDKFRHDVLSLERSGAISKNDKGDYEVISDYRTLSVKELATKFNMKGAFLY